MYAQCTCKVYNYTSRALLTRMNLIKQVLQVTQLSQRGRAARWVSYGQKWKTGTGR